MNIIRPGARKLFADGDIDLLAHTIKVVLLDVGYVYSDAHDFLNDVGAGTRVYTATLTGKDTTDGVFTVDDLVVTIPAGDEITQAWIYRDTGSEATSPLIAYYDTDDAGQPFEFTPDGTEVRIDFPSAAGVNVGLFSL